MPRFDVRKIKKLSARARYGELYYYWREAEHMIASSFPHSRRYGRRLKRKIENLYSQWFASAPNVAGLTTAFDSMAA